MTQKQIESYQELFDLMKNEYDLTLLQSEMDEIIRASQNVVKKFNEITDQELTEAIKDKYKIMELRKQLQEIAEFDKIKKGLKNMTVEISNRPKQSIFTRIINWIFKLK